MSEDSKSNANGESLLKAIQSLLGLKSPFENDIIVRLILVLWKRGDLTSLKQLHAEGVDIMVEVEDHFGMSGYITTAYLEIAEESGNQEVVEFAEQLRREQWGR